MFNLIAPTLPTTETQEWIPRYPFTPKKPVSDKERKKHEVKSKAEYAEYLQTDYWTEFKHMCREIYPTCLYPECERTNLTTAHIEYPEKRYNEAFDRVLTLCLKHHLQSDAQDEHWDLLPMHWILAEQQRRLEAYFGDLNTRTDVLE